MTELEKARQAIDNIDKEMVHLFTQRMDAVRQISEYKQAHDMPILDEGREQQVLDRSVAAVEKEEYRIYYREFLRGLIEISKKFQTELQNK